MFVTDTSIEALEMILKLVFWIQYLVKFYKDKETIQALIVFGNKINTMTPAYAAVLGLKVCPIAIRAQKIDNFSLQTFGMVIANF